jgi:ribosomal protein S27AE
MGLIELARRFWQRAGLAPGRENERETGSGSRNGLEERDLRDGRSSGQMARMKRGVGYCQNTECEDYAKGVFLLNHGDTFYCPRCRQLGKVEKERGFYTGNSDIFKEVRVEYNYDPIHGIYREIAIVRDESLWGRNNVYTLQSPLIKTEKRALKVAEAILANLNRYRGLLSGDDIPRTTEIILSFDESRDEFTRKLRQLSKEWEASGLRQVSR